MLEQSVYSFTAAVIPYGTFRGIEVPREVSEGLAAERRALTGSNASGRGPIAVVVTANGFRFRSTLLPQGNGAHRFFLNGEIRKRLRVDVGDLVDLEMEYDPLPRDIAIPDDVEETLSNAGKLGFFEALSPGIRRQILGWILDAKRPDTRARRIVTLCERLDEDGLGPAR
jgi:hypothetical protein